MLPTAHPRKVIATGLLGALLLSACAGGPAPRPDREPAPEPTTAESAPEEREPAPLPEDTPFAAVREALDRGDWMAAEVALSSANAAITTDPTVEAWRDYFQACIALLRGDLQTHQERLATLQRQGNLSQALQRELRLHRLAQAELAGDAQRAADAAYALLQAGETSPENAAIIEARLWHAAQETLGSGDQRRPAGWASWRALAAAASHPSGSEAAADIDRWLRQNPGHPATPRAQRLLIAAQQDATLARPALLLPLSGPLGEAGDAVSSGVLAGYFASNAGGRPRDALSSGIELLDSRRYERVADAYSAAVDRGADAVVGPLGKRQVEALLGLAPDLPTVSLNRPEEQVPGVPGVLQLSLAPEDEAEQLAKRAFSDGARRALLVRPEGSWGDRMEDALLRGWQPLGGRLAVRAVYTGNAASHAESLRQALALDASSERSNALRRLLGDLESSGRRREDIDAIFLLTKSADEARSLKPQIDYHYAGDLPVYALSTTDDGSGATARNRDLDGIRLTVPPWRLGETPPGIDTAGGFAALHALGVDAWGVLQRQHRLGAGEGLRYRGYTADFTVSPDGQLLRTLPLAEFASGALRPR